MVLILFVIMVLGHSTICVYIYMYIFIQGIRYRRLQGFLRLQWEYKRLPCWCLERRGGFVSR